MSIFILIGFIFGLSNEVSALSFDHDDTISIKAESYSSTNSINTEGCEDCHDDGCHDHDAHCTHHCSGLHNLIENKQSMSLNHETGVDSKIAWYFNFHYDEPFLDPALKPPLFS